MLKSLQIICNYTGMQAHYHKVTHIYKSITSSNDTNLSEMSSFISASNITTESNSRSKSNGSLIFGIYGNYKNQLLSMILVLLFQ